MTIVAIDDTDSRTEGMCTTYVATLLAEALEEEGYSIERALLIRLNPAIERKTRGNAALALHADAPMESAMDLAHEIVERYSETSDELTSPGIVAADTSSNTLPKPILRFSLDAIRHVHSLNKTLDLLDRSGLTHAAVTDDEGFGRIGALAAVGAWGAFDDWTYEHLTYRKLDRCGSPREVDHDSVFDAADTTYPAVWDTVDPVEGEVVCIPNAPGPVLYGIRGDDPDACESVADAINSEPVDRSRTFITNQGTDAHLDRGTIGSLREGAGYLVDGIITSEPTTIQGGHVFFELRSVAATEKSIDCVAFEPTKRFRAYVLKLQPGDRLTVAGEHEGGTIKLEKFAIRELVQTEWVNPTCPECDRRMESAGREQGYRCRTCERTHPSKVERPIDRSLERGWYEVPPVARRHIAKPLIRGGFDAPIHPETERS